MKQIAFTILLVTLAAVHAKYDIKYALPEQMLRYLAQRTSAFSELTFNLNNSTDSIQLKLEDLDTALYFKNRTASVRALNEQLEEVHFAIRYGSIVLKGQVFATVNGQKHRATFQSVQVDNSSIYLNVYYNNRTKKSVVAVRFTGAEEYIHSFSWDDCELRHPENDCFKAEQEILKSFEKQLPTVLKSKMKLAILNYGAPFQYKDSPDMPTTTPSYWTTVNTTTPRYPTTEYPPH